MKLKCKRDTFLKALQTVTPIVPQRTTIPSLINVRIKASKSKVSISATDQNVAYKATLGGKDLSVDEVGETLVAAERFQSILREMPCEEIKIERKSNKELLISGGGSRFKLLPSNLDGFPDFPRVGEKEEIEIDSTVLRELMDKTSFAAAKEKMKYALDGVLFSFTKNKVEAVATDGRRLALMGNKIDNEELSGKYLLPLRTVKHMERLIGDIEGNVHLGFDGGRVVLRHERGTLVSKLLEGQFPDYKKVIPKDHKNILKTGRDELASCVRQAAIQTSPDTRSIRLCLSGKELRCNSSSAGAGEATVKMSGEYDGKDIEILFNPDFIIDALRVVEDTAVSFEFNDSKSAGTLKADGNFLYVILPINLS